MNGVVTFTGLVLSNVGSNFTLQATAVLSSGANISGSSTPFTITAGPATQLVIQGDPTTGTTLTAGAPFGFTVLAEDAAGNVDMTYDRAITVSLKSTVGNATLQGTTTTFTASAGSDAIWGLSLDVGGSGYALQVSDGTFTTVSTNTFAIKAAAATQLVVATPPTASVQAGTGIFVKIAAEDPYNNVDLTFSDAETMSIGTNPTGDTLRGPKTIKAIAGVASFSNLTLSKAGAYTLVATSGNLSISTILFNITPASPSQLVLNQPGAPSSVIAGVGFGFSVTAEDLFGNTVPTYGTSPALSLTTPNQPPGEALGGTLSPSVSNGVFTYSEVTLDKVGHGITISITSGNLTPATTNTITVTPGQASQLEITTPQSPVTAGSSFGLIVTALDADGNVDTNYTGSIGLTLATPASETLGGTLQVNATAGMATFSGLTLDHAGSNYTIKAASDSLTGTSTNVFAVTPAAAYQLLIHTQPSPNATAGVAFPTQPVIYEVDQYGNLETGDDLTPITATLATGNGKLLGTTDETLSGGVATFRGLADKTAGTKSLNFAGGGLTAGPSNNVFVAPGPAAQLAIQTQPSAQVTAGNALTDPIVIDKEDQYGNVESGDNATVVTASLASGTGALQGPRSVTVHGGVATFSALAENKAGTISLQFAGGGINSVPSATIDVQPATPSKLVIANQPSSTATAGQAFATQPVILEEDQFGNVEDDNITALAVSLTSGTGVLQGSTSVTLKNGIAMFDDLAYDIAESISLRFTAGGLSVAPPAETVVSAAKPSKLVIQTQPSATAKAGQPFGAQPVVYEEDQFGNVELADISTVVTASLASGPGPLQGTTTATVSGGVARFTNLAGGTGGAIALKFTGGSVTSQATSAIQVAPNTPPNPTPTVLGATVVMTPKTKKKKAAFSGFKIQYSTPMNVSTVTSSTNYKLLATVKGTKTKIVGFAASYDASTNAVTLKINGENPFAKGGKLTIVASPPNGVSSQAGVFLSSSSLSFKIAANAKGITHA